MEYKRCESVQCDGLGWHISCLCRGLTSQCDSTIKSGNWKPCYRRRDTTTAVGSEGKSEQTNITPMSNTRTEIHVLRKEQ